MRTFTVDKLPEPDRYRLSVTAPHPETKAPVTTILLPGVPLEYLEGFVSGIATAEIEDYEGSEVRSLRRALHLAAGVIA